MKAAHTGILFSFLILFAGAFAQERDSGIYISPNDDGVQDALEFSIQIQDSRYIRHWAFIIENGDGEVVRTIEDRDTRPQVDTKSGFKGAMASIWRMITRVKRNVPLPDTLTWDGRTDSGEVAPDGKYFFHVRASDDNGNESSTERIAFYVDSEPPQVSAAPPRGADGLIFSPDGDRNKDTIEIRQSGSSEDLWEIAVLDATGTPVRTETFRGQEPSDFVWDGADDSGGIVPDGVYTYRISATDRAGNTGSAEIAGITVNTARPSVDVKVAASEFSPNGDGVLDTIEITPSIPVMDGLQRWTLSIVGEDGKAARVFNFPAQRSQSKPQPITFDGKDSRGRVLPDGKYTAQVVAEYSNGYKPVASSSAFVVNTTPPELTVTLSPSLFSPDGDGVDDVLFVDLAVASLSSVEEWSFEIREPEGTAGRVFWQTGGKGSVKKRVDWNGRSSDGELVQAATDYPYSFTVRDSVGMASTVKGNVPVDVLVIRDGDNIKMAVPSIVFASDAATFKGLSDEVVQRNSQILRRVAEILNRFESYAVVIEGHANNVTGTEREDTEELIPLSKARAETIKSILRRDGVSASRLSTVGMGGTRPIAAREDRDNWWKNRRVEFILKK